MNCQSLGGDRGDWVYNRIVVVKCDNVIPEEKQDKQLIEHLLEEAEYIASLAIKGLKEVIQNGYKYDIPAICKALNEDYKLDNHSFLMFMKECVIDRPTFGVIEDNCTVKRFYDVYKEWCKDNNKGYAETKNEIHKILAKMGKGEKIKTNGGYHYYKAITLNKQAKIDYKKLYDFDNSTDRPDVDFPSDNIPVCNDIFSPIFDWDNLNLNVSSDNLNIDLDI